jgi:hypothetical protein
MHEFLYFPAQDLTDQMDVAPIWKRFSNAHAESGQEFLYKTPKEN